MPTDDERREVARRLREIRLCKSGHIEWWRIAQALGLKEPTGWFGWEKFEPESVQRLADFIDPGELKTTCISEVKIEGEKLDEVVNRAIAEYTGIDRDALLALADEMDRSAHESEAYFAGVYPVDILEYAHRIREACGEVLR